MCMCHTSYDDVRNIHMKIHQYYYTQAQKLNLFNLSI